MTAKFKSAVKLWMLKRLKVSPPYTFITSNSIKEQRLSFATNNRVYEVITDNSTPLYEMITEITDYDCYQLFELRRMNSTAKIIVDIGANVGIATMALSEFPGSRVFAFEPVRANCEYFRANMATNRITNVTLFPYAVTDKDAVVSLEMDPSQSVSAHIGRGGAVQSGMKNIEVESISVHTLFDLLKSDNIDVLKMDCEGGEYEIVRQLAREPNLTVRAMTMEIHDQSKENNLKSMTGLLKQIGYRISYRPEMFGRTGLHHVLATRQ